MGLSVEATRENTGLFVIVFRHRPHLLRSTRRCGDIFTQRLQAVPERRIRKGAMRPAPMALVARALAGLYAQGLSWLGGDGLRAAGSIAKIPSPFAHYGLAVWREARGTPL